MPIWSYIFVTLMALALIGTKPALDWNQRRLDRKYAVVNPLMDPENTQLLRDFHTIPREDRTEVFETLVDPDEDPDKTLAMLKERALAALESRQLIVLPADQGLHEQMPSRYELEVLGSIKQNDRRLFSLQDEADRQQREFLAWQESERAAWDVLQARFDRDMQFLNTHRTILELR
jgi:hypothetical protein